MNAEPVKTYLVGIRVTQDLEEAKKWAQQSIVENVEWACKECGTHYGMESLANRCCNDEDLRRRRDAFFECAQQAQEDADYHRERVAAIDARLEKRIMQRAWDSLGGKEASDDAEKMKALNEKAQQLGVTPERTSND